MTYRSFAGLFPMNAWRAAYAVEHFPRPLPTAAQRREQAEAASPDDPHPLRRAFAATGESLLDYCKPWPGTKTRQRIGTVGDAAKCAACWVDSRLHFIEHLAGIDEIWGMFAPDVDTRKSFVRARLVYSDGSAAIVQQIGEPVDYTHDGRWFAERVVAVEYVIMDDPNQQWSYCNLLAHRYPHNASGADVVRIVLFSVEVEMPHPGVDAMAFYQRQQKLTANPPPIPGTWISDRSRASAQVWPDFYEFDVKQRRGRPLGDDMP